MESVGRSQSPALDGGNQSPKSVDVGHFIVFDPSVWTVAGGGSVGKVYSFDRYLSRSDSASSWEGVERHHSSRPSTPPDDPLLPSLAPKEDPDHMAKLVLGPDWDHVDVAGVGMRSRRH